MNKILNKQNLLYLVLCIAIVGLSQCSGSMESKLNTIAKDANSKCPKMLDQWTRLDSCKVFGDKKYKFYHTILADISAANPVLFKEQLTPIIEQTIKTTPEMKFFRDNNITLEYQYNDQGKKEFATIVMTPEEYKK